MEAPFGPNLHGIFNVTYQLAREPAANPLVVTENPELES